MQSFLRRIKNNGTGIIAAIFSIISCTIVFAYQFGAEKSDFKKTISIHDKDIEELKEFKEKFTEKIYQLIVESNTKVSEIDKKIIKIQTKLGID